MPAVSTPIDLTTLAAVKAWLAANGTPASTNTSDDGNIQACITAASLYWLLRLDLDSVLVFDHEGNITTGSQSPLVQPVTWDEWMDGNGAQRIWLRNTPIQTVSLVQVGEPGFGCPVPKTVPPSVGFAPGWLIDQSRKTLVLRGFYRFWRGLQNVNVAYTGGYVQTPADIALGTTKMVALSYKQKQWIGQRSQAMAQGAGTVTYDGLVIPKDVEHLIQMYTRVAVC